MASLSEEADSSAAKQRRQEKLEKLSNLLNNLGPITHSVVASNTSPENNNNTQNNNNNNRNRNFGYGSFGNYNRAITSNNNNNNTLTNHSFTPSSPDVNASNLSPSSSPRYSSLGGSVDFRNSKSPTRHDQNNNTTVITSGPKLSKFSQVHDTLLKAQKLLAQKPKKRLLDNSMEEGDEDDNDEEENSLNENITTKKTVTSPKSKKLLLMSPGTKSGLEERNEVKERLEKMLSVGNATENLQTLEQSIALFFGGGDKSAMFSSVGALDDPNHNNNNISMPLSLVEQKDQEERNKYLAEKQKKNEELFRRHHARSEALTKAGGSIERVFSLIPLADLNELS